MRGGHLHPLNLTLGLAWAAQKAGARLYTDTLVSGLAREATGWCLQTGQGSLTAAQVILTGDGMLTGLNKALDARVMPINNFIAVTEPLEAERAEALIRNCYAVSDSRFVVYYYRMTPDHRLLFGGGENYSYRFPTDVAGFVRPHILKIFPQLTDIKIDYAWGGTLGITANRMPMVREIEPDLYTAAGYSGLGVVLAPYFGKVLAQAILGQRMDFDLLARIPMMRFPGGPALRWPTLVAAMSLFALKDRL
jgi:gamma-glutamylputrescine oxidase